MDFFDSVEEELKNDPEFLREQLSIHAKEKEIAEQLITDLAKQVETMRGALGAIDQAIKCVHLDMSGKHRYALGHDAYKAVALAKEALALPTINTGPTSD